MGLVVRVFVLLTVIINFSVSMTIEQAISF